MTLDIAMGGSTNTVLHLLAVAQEAEVPFTMADIDRLSRRVPNLCKVAPIGALRSFGGCAPRRRNFRYSWRTGPRRAAASRDAHCAFSHAGRGHRQAGREARGRYSDRSLLSRRAWRSAHHGGVQPERALRRVGSGPRERRDPRPGARLQQRRRPSRALRQYRRGGLHREDGGRRSGAPHLYRAGAHL